MAQRPLILLSNDDGVHAVGIRTLRSALLEVGDVFTVAPEHEQSASSHRVTLSRPLRHRHLGHAIHTVDGTPADCVYIALNLEGLLPRPPDLVVSGINHGFNLGMDVIYSGTVAAAREAALRGLRAVAFSADAAADMDLAARAALPFVRRTLELPADEPILLNVNFPREIRGGALATRLGRRDYQDRVEARTDPRGLSYYWIGGTASPHDGQEGTDTSAVDAGVVSVTALSLEMTSAHQFAQASHVAGALPGDQA